MKHTLQRYFYWIQEEESEKDGEFAKKVHNTLNNIKDLTAEGATLNKSNSTPGNNNGPSMNSQQSLQQQ